MTILLVTPSEGFGELIRQTLEDEGSYRVDLAGDGAKALATTHTQVYSLAILDYDAEGMPLAELGHELLKESPDLRIIIVPPDNDPNHPSLADFSPHGYLTKPFYLPDLLGVVQNTLENTASPSIAISAASPQMEKSPPPTAIDILERVASPPNSSETPREAPAPMGKDTVVQLPPWLQDVNRAAQHLTRLSLETAAQAALITRGDQLYAYAGGYDQDVALELSEAVSLYWGRQGGSDLARFIRLEATGEEYMLYATALPGDMVLSLVFDAKTPFSQIRSQANQLAQRLTSGPKEDPSSSQPIAVSEPDKPTETPTMLPFDWIPDPSPLNDTLSEKEDDRAEHDIPADWQPIQPPSGERRSFLEQLLPDVTVPSTIPWEAEYPPEDWDETRPSWEHEPEAFAEDEETVPSLYASAEDLPLVSTETRPSTPRPPAQPPHPIEAKDFPTAEPVLPSEPTQALYNLSFACVMIPRFPHHYLTSDLAARLGEWIPQISVAFGWRVEHLAVRPEYVQFMINVPPATSPGYLMRIITKVTSQRVFAGFPRLQDENPSGEFWAPGYLIISSTQLPPHRMVKDFISQTRKRQGLK